MEMPPAIEFPARIERLFLHYFDTHFIADKGASAQSAQFEREIRLATRIAVASSETVYIPAASYYESPLCRRILTELDELVGFGFVVLSGSAPNIDEYMRQRQDEAFYRKGSAQHAWYRAQHDSIFDLPYLPRSRSATRDVTAHWNKNVRDDTLAHRLRDAVSGPIKALERRLEHIPEELGGLAFIPDHVYEILDLKNATPLMRTRISSVINEGYFKSYVEDLVAGVVVDLRYLASDFQMPSAGRNLSYAKMIRFLQEEGLLRELSECAPSHLVQMGKDLSWQRALQTRVSYVGLPGHEATAASRPPILLPPMTIIKSPMQNPAPPLTQMTVLCVAAAQVEFTAVHLRLRKDFGPEKLVYLDDEKKLYALQFSDSAGSAEWYLAGLSFQGTVEAAQAITEMRHALRPHLALMIGMCMGMPDRKLAVGTVVIPNEVFGFDHRRVTVSGEHFRPHGGFVDNGLYQVARILGSRPRNYRVIADKALASSSVKIEDVDAELVAHIKQTIPDAVAFDMEGFGFYRALQDHNCLWIKAVADSGEPQESTASHRDQKQQVQADVTDNAIDFAIDLVRFWATAQAVDKP